MIIAGCFLALLWLPEQLSEITLVLKYVASVLIVDGDFPRNRVFWTLASLIITLSHGKCITLITPLNLLTPQKIYSMLHSSLT